MYFGSHSIPELAGLKFAQRMLVIRSATEQVATPQKLLLNLLKLVILIPGKTVSSYCLYYWPIRC
jgi:hypothetical protein